MLGLIRLSGRPQVVSSRVCLPEIYSAVSVSKNAVHRILRLLGLVRGLAVGRMVCLVLAGLRFRH